MIKLRTVILSLAAILKCNLILTMETIELTAQKKITPQKNFINFLKKSNSIDIPTKDPQLHFKIKNKIAIAARIAYKLDHLKILIEKIDDFKKNYDETSENYKWLKSVIDHIEKLKKDPHKLELQKFNVPTMSEYPFDDFIKDL